MKRRLSSALTVCALIASVVVVAAPATPDAAAQLYDAPAIRFQANGRGDIDFVGNTLLTCPAGSNGCATAQNTGTGRAANNNYNMVPVDVDNLGTNSSTANLTLPPGAEVLFAGLYWGAASNSGNRGNVSFRTPLGAGYQQVTAAVVDSDGGENYQGFYDATAEVQAGGSGTYGVGNVAARTGRGRYAGWSMLVVYEDTSLPFRNLTVYDGYARVNQTNPVQITVDGFLTPTTGPVSAKVTNVVYEGDDRYTGDQMRFENTVLSDGAHPAGNFFNSRISKDGALFTDKGPDYVDQLGFDIARTDVTGLLANSQNSATIDYTSRGDWYYVGVVGTAIDIFVPDLDTDLVKDAADLNGGEVVPGDIIEYTVSSSNLGQDPAINAVLVDPIPTGTTFVPGSLQFIDHPIFGGTNPTDSTADADGAGFTGSSADFDIGRIDIGGTFEVSFQVEVQPGTEFSAIENNATLSYNGETLPETVYTNDGQTQFTVSDSADLVFESKVDSVDPVTAGTTFDYTMTVRNDGPSPAVNPVITDTLPAGMSFVSGAGCTAGPPVSCSLAAIAVGATGSATITVLVDPSAGASTVSNSADVTSDTPDEDTTNNAASETTEIIRSTDVAITKSADPDPVVAGTDIAYTLTVTNAGPSSGTNTIVSDVLPAGVTLVSATPDNGATCSGTALVTCDLGELGAPETVTITVIATTDNDLAATANLSNTASVTTTTPDSDDTNNSATISTDVDRSSTLALAKTGPATVNAGESISYTVTATNNGPSIADNAVIVDTLPPGLVFNAATSTPGCTLTSPPSEVSCPVGNLEPGAAGAASVTIAADVPSETLPGPITNSATVTADDATPATATHPTTVEREVALSIAKSDNAEPVTAGDSLVYTIVAGNAGPSDASGVVIADTLPAGVSGALAVFDPVTAGTCAGLSCQPTGGVLAAGDSVTITVTVTVDPGLPDGTVLSNSAAVTAIEDPVGATVTETTNTESVADLSIGKIASPNPVVAGEPVTYTISFVNGVNGSDAVNPSITDTLPPEVAFTTANFEPAVDGLCVHDGAPLGGTITCTPTTLLQGQTVTITVVGLVNPATADGIDISNTASGTADNGTPVSGTAVVQVNRQADLGVTKTASPTSPATVTAGEDIAYTIAIENFGPSDSSGVVALDPLPPGVTVVTPLPAGCVDNSGTINCDVGVLAAPGSSSGSPGTANITLIATVDPSTQPGTGLFPNTVTVTANEPDPNPDNDDNTVTVDVATSVGLSVVKTDNVDPVIAGETVIYSIEVGNTGPSDADGVTISDTPPVGLTWDQAGSTAGCDDTIAPPAITCAVGTVTPGGSGVVNLVFTVDADAAPGTVTNTATATSEEDPIGVTATQDTTIETRADVAVLKTAAPNPVVPGTDVTYTITATNNGPSVAETVTVTDALAGDLTFVSVDLAECAHDGTSPGGTVTCNLGALGVGETVTAIVVATVGEATLADVSNTATIATTTSDPNLLNDSSTATTEVEPQADIAVTKTDSIDPVIAGTALAYTIDVSNVDGPSTATNVVIVDALPAQLAYQASAGCAHSGEPFGGTVTCTIASLAAGASQQFVIDTIVDATTTSVITTNDVEATTDTIDTDPLNDTARESTVIEALADITIGKSVTPTTVTAGEQATYTLTLSNSGPSSAQAVNINDTLPAGVRFISATVTNGPGTCTGDGLAAGGAVACGFGIVEAGGTRRADVLVEVLSSATGTQTNSAAATSPTDPTPPSPATADITVQTSADLVMTEKTDNVDPAIAGQALIYTLSVRNDGPSDAVNAQIIDPLPAGVTFDLANSTTGCLGGATVTCDVGTLAPGDTASVQIAVNVDPSTTGVINNATATVSSATTDPDTTNNSQAQDTTIETQSNVTAIKSANPDPVVAGEQLTYTVDIVNSGPSDATNAVLTDPLPVGTSFVSGSASNGVTCTEAAGLVDCQLGTLVFPSTTTVTVVVDTNSDLLDGQSLQNTATINFDGGGPTNAPTSSGVIREADLTISKIDRENEVAAGTDITWDVAVTNLGPSDATNVVITDVLPPNTTFNAGASSTECVASGSDVICTLSAVAVGTPGAVVIAATVDSLVPPTNLVGMPTMLENAVSVTADETDPAPGNNDATELTTITQVNDLSIVKTDSIDPVVAGETITWTLNVANAGPSNASGIEIQDQLPPGVTFAGGELSCTDTPAGQPGALVTCTVPGVAAGDDVDISIVGTVDDALIVGNQITNSASITGFDGVDPVPDNNSDDEPTTISREAGLVLAKSASPDQVVAGEDLTFTLVLQNDGPSTAAAVTLVDTLPAELTYVSDSVIAGDALCNETSGTVRCDVGTAANGFSLAPGASVTVQIVGTTDADLVTGATITNLATADSPDSPAPVDAESMTQVVREADLALSKTATPDPVIAGETISYTLTVANSGPSDASSILIDDVLPDGVTWASGDCTATGQSVECSTAALAAGDSTSFTFVADVAADLATGSTFTNTAQVSAAETDPDDTNNDAQEPTTVDRSSDLSVTKTDNDATATAGETVSYTIEVANAGPSQASSVQIADAVPANTTFDIDGSTAGCTESGGTVTCDVAATIDPLSSAVVTVSFLVDDDLAPGSTLSNTVTATGAEDDPTPTNEASDATPVGASADVSVVKDAATTTAVAGTNLTWSLVVTNDGPSQATNVVVSDTLPAGLTAVSANPAECVPAGTSFTCTFATIDVGEVINISLVTQVDAAQTDPVSNQASVTTDTPDPDPSNNTSALVEVPVGLVSDLAIDKSSTPDPVTPGQPITYELVVTNNGPSAVVGALVEDTPPDEVVEPTSSCAVDAALGACTDQSINRTTSFLVDLAPGASATITVTGLVDPDATASFLNTATVQAPVGVTDPILDNNQDDDGVGSDPTIITDLEVTKTSSPNPARAGEPITYTIGVTNNGPSTAAGATITDVLPAAILNPSVNCTVDPTDGSCGVALGGNTLSGPVTLTPDTSLTITVDGTVDPAFVGTLANTATIDPGPNASDPTPGNNSASDSNTPDIAADVSIAKTTTATQAVAGETMPWTITVSNAGPSTATGVAVTDTLPAGLTIVSEPIGCTAGVCTLVDMAPGSNITLQFETLVASDLTGTVTNQASVTTATVDPDPSNNSADSAAIAVVAETDLTITKSSVPDPVVPGLDVFYTIIVTNNGPSDAVDANVTDSVPSAVENPQTTCSQVPAGGGCSIVTNGRDLDALISMAAGESVVLAMSGTVDSAFADPVLENTATVVAGPNNSDPDPTNNSGVDQNSAAREADLSLVKTSSPATPVPGESVSYTLVVANAGPSRAVAATIADQLPDDLLNPSATCDSQLPDACQVAVVGSTLSGTATIGATSSVTVTVTGTLDPNFTGTLENTARVDPPASITDPVPGNNEGSDTSGAVAPSADLSITKTANAPTVVASGTISWTVTVNNAGPSTATDVEVTDTLPAGLTIVTEPAECSDGVCSLGTIAPGGQQTLVFETLVAPDVTGTLVNTAEIDSPVDDPDPSNNIATSDPLPVEVVTDLTVLKTSSPDPVVAGVDVTYTLEVTNNGPSDAVDAVVTDAVPVEVLNPVTSCALVPAGTACAVTAAGQDSETTVSLPVGQTVTIEITGRMDATFIGSTENTAVVAPGPGASDPSPANNQSVNVNPSTGEVDLSVTKTSTPDPLVPGEQVTYAIVVANAGPSSALGATLVDLLPAELSNLSTSCTPTLPNICTAGLVGNELSATMSVELGSSVEVIVTGTLAADFTGTLTNTATVSPPPGVTDTDRTNDVGTDDAATAPSADLVIEKVADSPSVIAGESVGWTVTVRNDGPSTATDVVVTDTLPANVTIVSEPNGCSDGVCQLDEISPGATVTLAFETLVDAAVTGSIVNSAAVTSATDDPDPLNNTVDSNALPVEAATDLGVVKSSTPVVAGTSVTYTIVVTNYGPSDAFDAVVADSVPAEVLNPVTTCVTATGCAVTATGTSPEVTLSLAVGESATIEITGDVDPAAVDSIIDNVVTVTPGPGATDPSPTNNRAVATSESDGQADLVLTKTSAPAVLVPGEEVTYTITARNDGPSRVTDAQIVDLLPADLANAVATCAANAPNTCTSSIVNNELVGGLSLNPGTAVTFAVTARLDPDFTGTLENTASITPPPSITDPDPSNNASTDVAPAGPLADVFVSKVSDASSVVAGESVTWTVMVGNDGPSTATGVSLVDTVPAGLAIVDEPGVCSNGACDLGTIAVGAVVTLSFETEAVSTLTGSVVNAAVVSAVTADPDPANNQVTSAVLPVDVVTDLSIVKTSTPDPVVAGVDITYTLVVANAGPSASVDAVVSDLVPVEVENLAVVCAAVPVGAACSVDSATADSQATVSLPVGQSLTIEITGTMASDFFGFTQNTGTVTPGPGETDPLPGNNSSTNINPTEGEADLSIVKTSAPAVLVPGETLTYTLEVSNAGPSRAVAATVLDLLPAALLNPAASCVAIAPDACNVGTIGAELAATATLAAGSSATIEVTGTLDPSFTGTLSNTATVTPPFAITDPVPSNNSSADQAPAAASADIFVTKAPDAATVTAGETISWTITVGNNGPSTAADVTVTDTLPPGTTLVSEPSNCAGGVCPLGDITPGQVIALQFETLIAPDVTGTTANTATVDSPTPDPVRANNADTSTPIVVEVSTDLTIIKTSSPDPAVAGDPITYTLTVTNNGPSNAIGAVVSDAVPAQILSPVTTCATVPPGTSCVASTTGNQSTSTMSIPAGRSVEIEIVGELDSAATGSFDNTATVAAGPGATDPSPSNNSDTQNSESTGEADLSITKASTPAVLVPGEPITYTLVIENAGPSQAVGATVIDLLPAALLTPVANCVAATPNTCRVNVVGGELLANLTIARDGLITIEVTGTLDPNFDGTLENAATVDTPSTIIDPNSSNNTSTDRAPAEPSADLFVTKAANAASVTAGETVTWTVTVENAGPSTATSVMLTELLPADVTLVGEPAQCSSGLCALGTLEPDQPINLVFETLVDPTVTGTITNSATISSATPDPQADNNLVESAALPVDVVTDLSVIKTSAPDPIVAGSPVVYTVVVSNAGPSDAIDALVTDTVPAAVLSPTVVCSQAPLGTSCDVTTDGALSEVLVSLPVGRSVTLTISGTVDSDFEGSIENTATVAAGPGATDPSPANNSDVNINPSTGEADLTLTKVSQPDILVPGEPVTYTLIVGNDGPSRVVDATVLDLLPVELLTPSAQCQEAALIGANACTVAVVDNAATGSELTGTVTIAAGGSVSIEITATVDPAFVGNITNSAQVDPPAGVTDPDPTNNVATDVAAAVPSADLIVQKSAQAASVVAGETVVWNVRVANQGPSTATEVNVADLLPAGLTLVSEPPQCSNGSCAIGSMDPGDSTDLQFETRAEAALTGVTNNTATVSSPVADPDPANNVSIAPDLPIEVVTDLSVLKTSAPDPAVAGLEVVYTIEVFNNGPSDAVDAVVTDSIPAAVTNPEMVCDQVPSDATCTITGSGQQGEAVVSIPSGGALTLRIVGTVDSAFEGVIENTVEVAAGPGATDPSPTNNVDINLNPSSGEADLTITKTSEPANAVPGETITYTIVARNNGPSRVVDAQLTDLLPEVLQDLQATCQATQPNACDVSITGSELTGTLSLISDGTASITLIATVDPEATGTLTNRAVLSPPPGFTDPVPGNNTAVDENDLAPAADLYITKATPSSTAVVGTDIFWSVTVGNNGPSTATLVEITDTLPPGLTLISDQGGCIQARCVVVSLAPGEELTFEFVTRVGASTESPVVNEAEVTAATPDPVPQNNQVVSTPVDLIASTDLSITKTSAPAVLIAGGPVTYTLVVTNNGPSDAVGATVTDELPPEVTNASAQCVVVLVPALAGCTAEIIDGALVSSIDLVNGQSQTILIEATVAADYDGSVENVATVAAGAGAVDTAAGDNLAIDLNPATGESNLRLTKSISNVTPTVGSEVGWTLVVTNDGPSTVTDAVLTDRLPTAVGSARWTCAVSSGLAGCGSATGVGDVNVLLDMAAGSVIEVVVTATVTAAGADLTNSASIAVNGGFVDPEMGNNLAAVVAQSAGALPSGNPGPPPAAPPASQRGGTSGETAAVTTVTSPPATGPLAVTGRDSQRLTLMSLLLIVGGSASVLGSNRRRRRLNE